MYMYMGTPKTTLDMYNTHVYDIFKISHNQQLKGPVEKGDKCHHDTFEYLAFEVRVYTFFYNL